MLVVLAVFPRIAYWLAGLLGVQAPVNFIFLVILFALIVKVFMLALRMSKVESKLQDFAQKYAIDHVEDTAGKETDDDLEGQGTE